MTESYRIRIKHVEPDTWIITIKGSIIRDSGLYTCTAKNIAGGTMCSCNVSVVESLLNVPRPDLLTPLVAFKRRKFEEDYEVVKELSKSPNAAIYKVIEKRTAKEFIAKVSYKPEFNEWIKNEALCLNQLYQLMDSCLVKLHDAYETPEDMYILIFDEIKGDDIIKFMLSDKQSQQQALPSSTGASSSSMLAVPKREEERSGSVSPYVASFDERKIAIYIKQLLECLNELHSRNIVHLDVNPDNIIIDEKSHKLKLLGFTHAKHLKPDNLSNDSNEDFYHDYGNPEFVSPEIVLRQPITLNTDMWSIGSLCYILLSGSSPFYGTTIKETFYNIANNLWRFTDEFVNISHEAKDFITKLLQKDPKERMTAQQALNHPWMHYASHHIPVVELDKEEFDAILLKTGMG